jgi:hypothetical protein
MREELIKYGMDVSSDRLSEFIATIPRVDLTERGVATGSELAELEPTAAQIEVAKTAGAWDDAKPIESRMALMRINAKRKGLTLPENFMGAA